MNILHRIEYGAVRAGLAGFRALGPAQASDAGGAMARAIGPRLPVSRVAYDNLRAAFPDHSEAETQSIVRAVWDNLARNAAEFPHLGALRQTASGPGYEVIGGEHVAALVARGGPALILTAHCGNWEIIPGALRDLGLRIGFFYRAAANPAVDQTIIGLREAAMGEPMPMFAKGGQGARAAYRYLAQGGVLTMLTDQKLNDGIAVPLFGRDAMTTPALAVFARRFRCPILPLHIERIGPARLRVICEPLVFAQQSDDKTADIAATTLWMNQRIEAWVRAQPGQWLWLHRRWPKG